MKKFLLIAPVLLVGCVPIPEPTVTGSPYIITGENHDEQTNTGTLTIGLVILPPESE